MIVNYYLLFFLFSITNINLLNGFIPHKGYIKRGEILTLNLERKNYHFSQRYTEQLLKKIQLNNRNHIPNEPERLLKDLNSRNSTTQNLAILGQNTDNFNRTVEQPRLRIIINPNTHPNFLAGLGIPFNPMEEQFADLNRRANGDGDDGESIGDEVECGMSDVDDDNASID